MDDLNAHRVGCATRRWVAERERSVLSQRVAECVASLAVYSGGVGGRCDRCVALVVAVNSKLASDVHIASV